MQLEDGTLVTSRTSHEVYVIEGGRRRWVPDAWTMHAKGLSPADLVFVEDEELGQIPGGEPIPSAVPAPRFEEGAIVETEDGVFVLSKGKLRKVPDPRQLLVDGRPPENVVFLPASLCRSLYQTEGGVE